MVIKKEANEWKDELEDILASKVEEFKLMGYGKATTENIWTCLEKEVWKNNPKLGIAEIIGAIFQLKPTTYMNYLTFSTYSENDDLLASIRALTGKNDSQ